MIDTSKLIYTVMSNDDKQHPWANYEYNNCDINKLVFNSHLLIVVK